MNKLVNFFTSTYYDNIKYKHSTASLLKIFFERANKTTQTVASLGNVYRNSKWSDLKVQNIKVTHIRGFLVALVLFISFIILCYLLVFRSENSTISTLLKPLTFLWSYLSLVLALWILCSVEQQHFKISITASSTFRTF